MIEAGFHFSSVRVFEPVYNPKAVTREYFYSAIRYYFRQSCTFDQSLIPLKLAIQLLWLLNLNQAGDFGTKTSGAYLPPDFTDCRKPESLLPDALMPSEHVLCRYRFFHLLFTADLNVELRCRPLPWTCRLTSDQFPLRQPSWSRLNLVLLSCSKNGPTVFSFINRPCDVDKAAAS